MLNYIVPNNILVTIMFKNKLLLLLSVLFLSCSTSFANSRKNNFYLKTIVTASKLDDVKVIEQDMNFNLDHASKLSPLIGMGIGYYINDYTRVDFIFEHLNFNFKEETSSFNYTENNTSTTGAKSIRRKAHGNSLMFNSYIDLLNRGAFKIFVGAGVGAVQIKEKVCNLISGNATTNDQIYTFPLITETFISKTSTNFAHSLMIGTDIKVNPEISLELMYSWKDFGKTKYKIKDKEKIPEKNRYKGHNFSIGIRFDL